MPALEGELRKLELAAGVVQGDVVSCTLCVASSGIEQRLPLNDLLGAGLRIEISGRIRCGHCGHATRKSYGGGYCYHCFSTLARCDLCVMSPDRCHYHEGTCREPEWAEGFCMREHLVYLANSSGLKVGITREGRQLGRWMDQGAVQALPILSATTRRVAGLAEVTIARLMSDRTDWHRLVSADAEPVDLQAEQRALFARRLTLPRDVRWRDEDPVLLSYPVLRYPDEIRRLQLHPGKPVVGNLLGIKGQYLLLSSGVLNVARYNGYAATVAVTEPVAETMTPQLDLFDDAD